MDDQTQHEISKSVETPSLEQTGDDFEQRAHHLKRTNDCLERTDDCLEGPAKRSRKGTDPASARVLGTTELLEAILLQLPMRDLLFAQGVSKRFEEVIAGSLAIQRALFFEPEVLVQGATGDETSLRVKNPLLRQMWHDTDNRPVVMNKTGASFVLGSDYPTESDNVRLYGVCQGGGNLGPSRETGRRCFPTGSWRRMFLSQPPAPVTIARPTALAAADEGTTTPIAKTLGQLWQPHCYGSGDAFRGFLNTSDEQSPELTFT